MPKLEVAWSSGSFVKVNVPLTSVANNMFGSKSNFVSYAEDQIKTEEEKARARRNIGLDDESLILNGLTSTVTADMTHVSTFVNADGRTSITIPRALHQKGSNPIVQCYVNNALTTFDVINDGDGNITVSWGSAENLSDYDVLNVHIISSKKGFAYEGELGGSSITVTKQSHECGLYPIVQVWYGGELASDLASVSCAEGDVTVSWGEEVEVTSNSKIVVLFTDSSFVGEPYKNPNGGSELVVSKEQNGIGDAPLVFCYCGGELAPLGVTNNSDELIVDWGGVTTVSSERPLVVVVGSELTVEDLGAKDLSRVAWTGLYGDLKNRPTFVATYTNVNNRRSLVISAAAHKCGADVTVQCKVNDSFIYTNTTVDRRGNVYISWNSPSLVSASRPMTVYIYGYKVKSKNIDEKKNEVDLNTVIEEPNGSGEGGGGTDTPITPVQPHDEHEGQVKVTAELFDAHTNETIGVLEQYFAANSEVRVSDFNEWADIAAKYESDSTEFEIGSTDVTIQVRLSGKPYELTYVLHLEYTDGTTNTVFGTVSDARYNTAMDVGSIAYIEPRSQSSRLIGANNIKEWETTPEIGEMRDGNIYIMNDEYASSVTLVGYVNVEL